MHKRGKSGICDGGGGGREQHLSLPYPPPFFFLSTHTYMFYTYLGLSYTYTGFKHYLLELIFFLHWSLALTSSLNNVRLRKTNSTLCIIHIYMYVHTSLPVISGNKLSPCLYSNSITAKYFDKFYNKRASDDKVG